jgi:hypothetical protein
LQAARPVNQWEIYDYPFAEEGSHPVLIISNPGRSGNDAFTELNGLFCRSVRPSFHPKTFYSVLDQADGLDNLTVARCDHIYVIRREFIGMRRGIVSPTRRLPLFRKVLESFQCPPR